MEDGLRERMGIAGRRRSSESKPHRRAHKAITERIRYAGSEIGSYRRRSAIGLRIRKGRRTQIARRCVKDRHNLEVGIYGCTDTDGYIRRSPGIFRHDEVRWTSVGQCENRRGRQGRRTTARAFASQERRSSLSS
jgi:hypothetical protein